VINHEDEGNAIVRQMRIDAEIVDGEWEGLGDLEC
jgi:hypothetical protein